jgi:hypothetical protein
MESPERFEFKFLLGAAQHDTLFSLLERGLKPDLQGGPTGVYPVVSLYYDTPDRRCYWEAWRKMPSRRKLRVRVYGSTDGRIAPTSFIEVKHKVDGLGFKRRVQTDLQNALALVDGGGVEEGLSPEELRTVLETRHMVGIEGFAPSCTIRYLRHAYWLSLDALEEGAVKDGQRTAPLRMTLDSGLMTRFDQLEPEPDDRRFSVELLATGTRVLEIKGNGAIPFRLALLLARAGIRSTGMSKYCKAVEYLLNAERLPGPRAFSV